jgi:transcriptional regulator with XRE-family HTH domain
MANTRERAPETASRVFGRQVEAARKRLHLTQAGLAKRLKELGINSHQATVARIETGGRRVSVDDALALAAALGVSPLHLLAASYTHDPVPVTPNIEAGPGQMRRWLTGQAQLPTLDEDAFFEVVPDDERVARQRRGIQHLRQSYMEWEEAVLAKDPGGMRDALKDIERELARQEADLDREERMAKKGDQHG